MKRIFLVMSMVLLLVPSLCEASVWEWLFDDERVVDYEQVYQKRFDVSNGSGVKVYNINGGVKVEEWKKDSVEVYALIKSRRGKKEVEKVQILVKEGDDLIIRTEHLKKNPKITIEYTIKVPEFVTVKKIKTVNGSIKLNGVSGKKIKLESVNGSIRAEDVDGFINAETVNGSIKIKGCSGLGELETTNGSITAELNSIRNDIDINTTNGSVKFYLADGIDAEIELSTFNGRIKIDDLKLKKMDIIGKRRVEAVIGDGGSKIIIDTTNGSISLYEL